MQDATEPRDLLSAEEAAHVREQMDRLLETHLFRNSRRYPALLRFVVEETLQGRGELLKERLIGVHVFERPADYDTAADPIVRVTIAEIRKRIAQYYHDEDHDAEIRIELLPGRYTPEFRLRREKPAPADHLPAHASDPAAALPPLPIAAAETRPAPPVHAPAQRARPNLRIAAISLATLLALALVAVFLWTRPTAVDRMWAPLLASSRSLLFCVPTDVGKPSDGRDGHPPVLTPPPTTTGFSSGSTTVKTFLDYEAKGENVVYSDMMATLDIANIFSSHHHEYRVRLNTATTLNDLRTGPTVLIGGLDNQWTMRALAPLRYHFAGTDEDGYWIADDKTPANRAWSLNLREQYQKVTHDYAIVARLHDDQTGQPEMIVAGIGMSGTSAAGEFLANEAAMRALQQRLGPGFKDRDIEVVLSTDVVNGIAGAAKVLAATSW